MSCRILGTIRPETEVVRRCTIVQFCEAVDLSIHLGIYKTKKRKKKNVPNAYVFSSRRHILLALKHYCRRQHAFDSDAKCKSHHHDILADPHNHLLNRKTMNINDFDDKQKIREQTGNPISNCHRTLTMRTSAAALIVSRILYGHSNKYAKRYMKLRCATAR